ncbi:MAG: outer membrane beta-barrel protein [Gammaproteobacteria bacterium]|nr:outer membrane beta-barrel protein [Gammaproteobacteria bacterium]
MKKTMMHKWIVLLLSFTSVNTAFAFSNLHPVFGIAYGVDNVNLTQNKIIALIAPFENTYKSSHRGEASVYNLFVGVESAFQHNIFGQIGLSYYLTNTLTTKGDILQFNDPSFNNLSYQFKTKNQRILIETKLLFTLKQNLHPYLLAGAGLAFNRSYGYSEQSLDGASVPMQSSFANHSATSFSYTVGLGVDVDVSTHVRLGGSYRYVDLGQAGLGTTASQSSTQTLNYNHLKTNEFLVQLDYIC